MVCSDNVKKFVSNELHDYLISQDITHQATAPYAHQQNGKAECYIRTIKDLAQAMMAWSGLPMSFFGDAILTTQYLWICLPTSTLPSLTTSYKVMEGNKSDLLHLCIWDCHCFILYPSEVQIKGSEQRFEAIFVGYDKNCLSWRVQDLNRKYFFLKDVIFDELVPGHLHPHSIQHISIPPPQLASVLDSPVQCLDRLFATSSKFCTS